MQQNDQNQLYSRVWGFIDKRQHKQALQACQHLNHQYPDFDKGWYLGSVLASKYGNPKIALSYIDRALTLAPSNFFWRLHKARCLVSTGNMTDALALAQPLTHINTDDKRFYVELAELLTQLQQYRPALTAYEQALRLDPKQPDYHFNRATLLRFLGEFEQAEAACNQSIKLGVSNCEVYLLRSELRTQTKDKNHIVALKQCLKNTTLPWPAQVQLYYSLAKEFEDLQDYTNAFKHLQQGADLRRAHMQYDVAGDEQTMAQIIHHYSHPMFNRNIAGYDTSEPIFILGLPRTGTTLVERILSSHSHVTSAGELNNFAQQMVALIQSTQKQGERDKLSLVAASVELDFIQLGEKYLNSTRPLSGQTPYFIDKMPLNFLYIGLIALALPKAKIIHLTRDPMDTCYAMYKCLFKHAYPFSYNLNDLGRYYIAYHQLMAHWQQVLPDRIYNLSYEKLVTNTPEQAQALVAHCELPWQDSCLDFHKNQAAVATASAHQVRQPVYSSSINKWQQYQQPLQPLYQMLNDAVFQI